MYARIIKSITKRKMLVDGVMQDVGELHYLIQTSDKCLDKRFMEITDYNHLDPKEGYVINKSAEIIDDRVYYVYSYAEEQVEEYVN